MLINRLVLLILAAKSVVRGQYFGPAHNNFRRLCVTMLLPGSHNTNPQLDVFRYWWDNHLRNAGQKLFPGISQSNYLSSAEDHCAGLEDLQLEQDPICAYRDFVNIGNLIETDLRNIEQTLDMSDKTPSFYYRPYSASWLGHPRMFRLKCRNDMIPLWKFIGKISTAVETPDENLLTHIKNVFQSPNAVGLLGEIEKTDCRREASRDFCQVKYLIEIAKKVEILLNTDWTGTIYQTAIQMHFYGLKLRAPEDTKNSFLSTTEQEVKAWMRDILADVVESLQEGTSKYDHVIKVGDLLPPAHYLPCDILASFPSLSRMLCTFGGVIYPLKPYIQSLIVAKSGSRKLVSTTIRYDTYLSETRFGQILELSEITRYTLTEIAQELKAKMDTQTEDIKAFFQTTVDFDIKIAKADVEAISSDLQQYQITATDYGKELDGILQGIIVGAYVAVLGDVTESLNILALEIATKSNPGAWIFGGSPGDIISAGQQLAQDIANIPRLVRLSVELGNLLDASKTFAEKINESEKQLKPVKDLLDELDKDEATEDFDEAKDRFINLYGEYAPVIGSDDLAGLTAYWTNVISEGCGILDSTHGIVSGATKAVIGGLWLCPRADIAVNKLFAVYDELVAYQDSMMDILVNYVRATGTYNAATAINKDYTGTKPTGVDLELLAGFSTVAYQVAIFSAMESYCNILEYKEGEAPVECTGRRDITSLLSRKEKRCDYIKRLVTIPTKPVDINDTSFIDLESLYAGKTVAFQAPDLNWLLEHKWISPAWRLSKFFMHNFDIYLPTISNRKKTVTVTAEASIGNRHHPPGGTEYIIKPGIPLPVFSYEEGMHGLTCGDDDSSKTSVYTNCRQFPNICLLTNRDIIEENSKVPTDVYPSIYAKWQLRVQGYEAARLSVPASDFKLRANIEFCMLYEAPPVYVPPATPEIDAAMNGCCGTDQYFHLSSQQCMPCPPGSTMKYDGLFCGDVSQLVVETSNETDDSFFTFAEAITKCQTLGTSITTPAEMDTAVAKGYDACACGWLSDGSKRAPRPNEICTENAGTGVNGIECTGRDKWPVYCGTNY